MNFSRSGRIATTCAPAALTLACTSASAVVFTRQYGHQCPRLKAIATGPLFRSPARLTSFPWSSGSMKGGIGSPAPGEFAPTSLAVRRAISRSTAPAKRGFNVRTSSATSFSRSLIEASMWRARSIASPIAVVSGFEVIRQPQNPLQRVQAPWTSIRSATSAPRSKSISRTLSRDSVRKAMELMRPARQKNSTTKSGSARRASQKSPDWRPVAVAAGAIARRYWNNRTSIFSAVNGMREKAITPTGRQTTR